MMQFMLALLVIASGFSISAQAIEEVPVYDYTWEDENADYGQICEMTEYEKPSVVMVWLQSIGGAIYVKLCSAGEFVAAKWYALQKVLGLRARQKIEESSDESSP